jgi:hypothetical protein
MFARWGIGACLVAAVIGCGGGKSADVSAGTGGSGALGSGGSVSTPQGAPAFAGSDGLQYNGAVRWERKL